MSKIDLKIRPVTKNDTLELIPVVRSYIVDFINAQILLIMN